MELKAPTSRLKKAMLLMAKIGNGSGVPITWTMYQRPELTIDSSLKLLPVKLDYMQATWTSLKRQKLHFRGTRSETLPRSISLTGFLPRSINCRPGNHLLKLGSPLALVAAARWNLLCATCISSRLSLEIPLNA